MEKLLGKTLLSKRWSNYWFISRLRRIVLPIACWRLCPISQVHVQVSGGALDISAEGGQVSQKGTPVFSPGMEFNSKKNQYYYVVTPKYPICQLIQNLILELTNIWIKSGLDFHLSLITYYWRASFTFNLFIPLIRLKNNH